MRLSRQVAVVSVAGLGDRQARRFGYVDAFGREAEGVIVRLEGALYAYRNLCPHWSVALDHEGRFFAPEGEELMCHTHGATFDARTGACTFGPPEGARLEAFTLEEIPGDPTSRRVLRGASLRV